MYPTHLDFCDQVTLQKLLPKQLMISKWTVDADQGRPFWVLTANFGTRLENISKNIILATLEPLHKVIIDTYLTLVDIIEGPRLTDDSLESNMEFPMESYQFLKLLIADTTKPRP